MDGESAFDVAKGCNTLAQMFGKLRDHSDFSAAVAVVYLCVLDYCTACGFRRDIKAVAKLRDSVRSNTYFCLTDEGIRELNDCYNDEKRIIVIMLMDALKLMDGGDNFVAAASEITKAVDGYAESIGAHTHEFQLQIMPHIKLALAYCPLTNESQQ